MDSLAITDGVISVDLAGGSNSLLEYNPRAAVDSDSGGVASTVTERVRLAFTGDTPLGGTSLALAIAERDKLERLLRQAGRVANGSGELAVYIQGKREPDLALYRSLVLGGGIGERDGDGYWPERGVVRCTLYLVRCAWWEGAEAEVGLLDLLGVAGTGGQVVACGHGPRASGVNYVDLDSIGGSLPAPLKLQFCNEAVGVSVKRVWAGLIAAPDCQTGTFTLDSDAAAWGGTRVPSGETMDTQYSGGCALTSTWSTRDATTLIYWALTGAAMAKYADRWFAVVGRWAPSPAYTNLLVQARLTIASTTTLWAGPWVLHEAAHELCDLGALRLPPAAIGTSALSALRLELWGKRDAAGDHTLVTDYLALLPLDGMRRYQALSAGLAQSATLVDDAPAGLLYALASSARSADWVAAGDALRVRPGQKHRLVLAWESSAGVASANKPASGRVYYRPRVAVP